MKLQDVDTVKLRSIPQMIEDSVRFFESQPGQSSPPLWKFAVGLQSHTGIPVKIARQGNESWVLLWSEPRGEASSVTLLPLARIDSATLLNPAQHLTLLTEGETPLNSDAAPGRLVLDREVAAASAEFGKTPWNLSWNGLETEATVRAAASALIGNFRTLMQAWVKEPMAVESLNRLERITFTAAPNTGLEVTREGSTLNIRFGANLKTRTLTEELKTQTENQL